MTFDQVLHDDKYMYNQEQRESKLSLHSVNVNNFAVSI